MSFFTHTIINIRVIAFHKVMYLWKSFSSHTCFPEETLLNSMEYISIPMQMTPSCIYLRNQRRQNSEWRFQLVLKTWSLGLSQISSFLIHTKQHQNRGLGTVVWLFKVSLFKLLAALSCTEITMFHVSDFFSLSFLLTRAHLHWRLHIRFPPITVWKHIWINIDYKCPHLLLIINNQNYPS